MDGRTQRVLIIQHDHASPPGAVADRFRERGFSETLFQVVPAENFEAPGIDVEFPDPHGFDALVVMGSYWSAWDDDLIGSWLQPEMELLRAADAAGIPVLGICFGGQLLARTHGGSVARAPAPEIGFVEVVSEREDLAPAGTWFAWHYDRWQAPPDAVEFARNAMASQGFTVRHNLAIQFHPKLSSDMLTGWCANGGREMLDSTGRDAGGHRVKYATCRSAPFVARIADHARGNAPTGRGPPSFARPLDTHS